jgi:hypothetical protein
MILLLSRDPLTFSPLKREGAFFKAASYHAVWVVVTHGEGNIVKHI